jgi:hypothetical protein
VTTDRKTQAVFVIRAIAARGHGVEPLSCTR